MSVDVTEIAKLADEVRQLKLTKEEVGARLLTMEIPEPAFMPIVRMFLAYHSNREETERAMKVIYGVKMSDGSPALKS